MTAQRLIRVAWCIDAQIKSNQGKCSFWCSCRKSRKFYTKWDKIINTSFCFCLFLTHWDASVNKIQRSTPMSEGKLFYQYRYLVWFYQCYTVVWQKSAHISGPSPSPSFSNDRHYKLTQASSRVAALHLQEDGLGIVLKVNVKRDPEC